MRPAQKKALADDLAKQEKSKEEVLKKRRPAGDKDKALADYFASRAKTKKKREDAAKK